MKKTIEAKPGAESEPIAVYQHKTWREQFEEYLALATEAKEDPAIVIYYQEALREEFPGPVWEQFKNSIAYPYWRPAVEESHEYVELKKSWGL